MKKSTRPERLRDNPFEAVPTHTAPFKLPLPEYLTVTAIRQFGTLSRTRIAETIGYSPSKITAVVNDLLRDGIVEELGSGPPTGARRAKELGFNPNFGYVVAVRVGFSKLEIALVDFSGHIRVRRMLPLPHPADPDTVLNEICNVVQERIDKLGIPMSAVLSFSITVPGAVDIQSGTLFDSPFMPSWGGYQIDSVIRESFPYAMVHVENEANAMAFGELRQGGARQLRSLIYVNVGASINSGIILDEQIYRGANGRAGDIGQMHVTHRSGGVEETVPLEALVSGAAIVAQARRMVQAGMDTLLAGYDLEALTVREVGTAATEGDRGAKQIIQQCGQILGGTLANIVNFLDPDLVLIGGAVNDVAPAFLASVRRSVWDRSPALATQPLRIEIAPLGPEASILWAIALALESIFVSSK
ncbi:MAG: ROK family transcriptional regulator [Anaerolineae bacterium]|nr:ROK family transcriptional regulator [Anaerolineae bacterium]